METYDVIVVGAGTSGMMAAISAAEAGAHVLIIEKNKRVGKKLLLTGGGRCNVTNSHSADDIIAHIPGNGKFLYSAFSQWNNHDIIDFFQQHGIPLKEEDHGRMFPVSDKSTSIVETLFETMKALNIALISQAEVKKLIHKEQQIYGVRTSKGEFKAPCVIITTGGQTYPSTGSTGDGYRMAKQVGHSISTLYPTESPLMSKDPFIMNKTLQGLSLQNVQLSVLDEKNKVLVAHQMDILFTHFGLSGPAALRCSSFVNQQLQKNGGTPVTVHLDCFPERSAELLTQQLLTTLTASKKNVKNALTGLLPERLLLFFLTQCHLSEENAASVSENQLTSFIQLCKQFPIHINKTFPLEKSFVTGGGVQLKEIHPKTMESKLIHGLFFAGEVLDINGYTGGYNITAAFVTGHAAGQHAAEIAAYTYLNE